MTGRHGETKNQREQQCGPVVGGGRDKKVMNSDDRFIYFFDVEVV